MTNFNVKWYGTALILLLIASPFIGWGLAKQYPLVPPITSKDYPPATKDLTIIETWTEEEVYNFASHLGCFDIQLNWDFEEQHPEEAAFCDAVTSIWNKKYKARKAGNINWELFNSLSAE